MTKPKKEKEKEYEVTVFVDGVEYPEVAILNIQATTPREAVEWVAEHLTLKCENTTI